MDAPGKKVFEYLDYRKYLADHYEYRKQTEYGFSYRVFARRAGCKSTNYPHLVIHGRRNLSADAALRFAVACGLNESESRYFIDLCAYNQATTQREKTHHYQRLSQHVRFKQVHQITEAQASYYAQWYLVAIRELAAREDFSSDPQWIAAMLVPSITPAQARRALTTLRKLGLLVEDQDGRLRRAQPMIGHEGPLGHHLIDFHQSMLKRASEALEIVPREEREFGALTLCISEARYDELREIIKQFRRELHQRMESSSEPAERVVQISVHVFPLSKKMQAKEQAGASLRSPSPRRPSSSRSSKKIQE